MTTDRTEFLGNLGSYTRPAALERVGLTPHLETGSDPCGVLQFLLWLQPGETKEITFLLASREESGAPIDVYSPRSPLGSAINGKRVGEKVEYELPNGKTLGVEIIDAVPYNGM